MSASSQSRFAEWMPNNHTLPKKANTVLTLATTMTPPPASSYGIEENASVLERLQGFVAENKRAILIGTAAVLLAVGGVAAYQYHVASSSAGASGSRRRTRRGGDAEKGEGEPGGDGKKRKSKKKTVKDKDGPILEPVKPGECGFLFLLFRLCAPC